MSMIENLDKIKKIGLGQFMKAENRRWGCKKCGNPICVHNKKCYFCEMNKKNLTGR
jgi:rubrerythrin